jgi:epoxyqueuosine reductase
VSGQMISTASAAVQDFLSKLDVDAVGVASLSDLKGSKLEETALRLLPETHSIVVFAMEIYPEILDHARPGRTMGLASLNDLMDRNADFLSGRLTKAAYDVARVSRRNSLKALPLPAAGCPLDTRFLEAVFSYKHAGQAAGLGYIGLSSLLITSDFGPRVRLSCCLTEALLKPSKVATSSVCEGCDICIENCPARALNRPVAEEPYVINKFACASFRNASGGCSDCMRICPAGR